MEKLGCYYLHIFYPSHLYINQKKPFEFELDSVQFHVIVTRPLKSLIINDFNNKILSHKNEEGINFHQPEIKDITVSKKSIVTILDTNEVGYILDYDKNQHREFYTKDYTELIIVFETIEAQTNITLGIKALNHFINSYRFVSGDILTLSLDKISYLPKVLKEYFHPYSSEELNTPNAERIKKPREIQLGVKQVLLPFWNTQGRKFDIDQTTTASNLSDFFQQKTRPDNLAEFILKAREELEVHKNYKYSFIETWTSLEIAITSLLKKRKLQKGISKTKIDSFESEVGISYLLNIELPLTQDSNDENFKSLINKIDAIRRIRNKVIHENKNISLEEAENAYRVALEFLDYMGILKIKREI
jgi:hypothetical protein